MIGKITVMNYNTSHTDSKIGIVDIETKTWLNVPAMIKRRNMKSYLHGNSLHQVMIIEVPWTIADCHVKFYSLSRIEPTVISCSQIKALIIA